jgi:hypothetical protein
MSKKARTSFFEKKEAKKLLSLSRAGETVAYPPKTPVVIASVAKQSIFPAASHPGEARRWRPVIRIGRGVRNDAFFPPTAR